MSNQAAKVGHRTSEQKKSGLKIIKAGNILFNDGDQAESFYIIQKGQLRLFRPKGRGFVEIAVLRAGDVIGEMAFFDNDQSKRSCSAAALTDTEVIEISFKALEKTLSSLNPWFRTMIVSLADRLRKSNDRVKSLENNSLGFGKVSEYKFFHTSDIVRALSLSFMGIKAHGERMDDGSCCVHSRLLKFYMIDIFNFQEAKYEEFFSLLKNLKMLEMIEDKDKLPNMMKFYDVDSLRSIMLYINAQKMVADEKKTKISSHCELLLDVILEQIKLERLEVDKEGYCLVSVSDALKVAKEKKGVNYTESDLGEAIKAGFCQDIIVAEDNSFKCNVNIVKLRKDFPAIKFMNAVDAVNKSKDTKGNY